MCPVHGHHTSVLIESKRASVGESQPSRSRSPVTSSGSVSGVPSAASVACGALASGIVACGGELGRCIFVAKAASAGAGK